MNARRDKRRNRRLRANLHVKLTSGAATSWGVLSDVSENGLLIKSNRDFAADTVIDLEIIIQDNCSSLLKGKVIRKIELPETHRKYGLGIELIEKDFRFLDFVCSLFDRPVKTASETD
jgi:hypothetical protein